MRRNKLTTRGDTIVEVLIVLAVLSLAFAIASATASRALNQSRNAQEHSKGLGVLDTQIELLRQAVAAADPNVFADGKPFCIPLSGADQGKVHQFPPTFVFNPSADLDNLDDTLPLSNKFRYPDECIQGPNNLYHVMAVYSAAESNFSLYSRWDGIGTLGRQQETMAYRIQNVTASSTAFTDVTPGTPPDFTLALTVNGSTGSVSLRTTESADIAWSVTGPDTPTCTESLGGISSSTSIGSSSNGTATYSVGTLFGRYGRAITVTFDCTTTNVYGTTHKRATVSISILVVKT